MADREADIYEVFQEHEKQSSYGKAADWFIQGEYNRALRNESYLIQEVEKAKILGEIGFDIPPGRNRQIRHDVQTLRSCRVTLKGVHRPGGRLEDMTITVLLVREKNLPDLESAVQ